MRLLDHEHVRVISVNARLRLLGVDEVSRGTLNESLFHAREVFRPAISRHAYGIILVHNHPSGDPAPSEADHRITRRLRQAGDTLDIPVLDHVILGSPAPHRPRPWFSFRECGALG
jgi:DNA repair protein RadC